MREFAFLPGEHVDCGVFSLREEEIFDFARRYDAQDFHLSHEAAKKSIFGRLTASGLHSASVTRRAVLKHVFADVGFLASPAARRFQMHKPVYPDMEVAVRHQVTAVRKLYGWPGIVEVDGSATGRNRDGELVIAMDETNWLAEQGGTVIPEELFDRTFVRPVPARFLEPARRPGVIDTSGRQEPIFLEDAFVGARFVPATFEVGEAEAVRYHREFDASGHANHWLAVCLGVPIFAEVFYLRSANMGGPGIEDIVFGHPVQAGDRLDAEMEISVSRPMNSKPGLGVCTADCTVWNQQGLLVTTFRSTTFLRRRTA